MSYEFHITKENGIDLNIWKKAAVKIGVQLLPSAKTSVVQFGKSIEIGNNDGDGVLSCGTLSSIRLNFRRGEISFVAPNDWDSFDDGIKKKLKELLNDLSAEIIGDEGEIIEL